MTSKIFHKPDYVFIITLGVILILGLVMLSSVSTVVAFQRFDDSYYYLKHQLLNGIVPGLILFALASKINYQRYRKLAFPALIVSLLLLSAVFWPGLGFAYGGARRWLKFGEFLFQPAELVKLCFIIYLAGWLEKKGEKGTGEFYYGFFPFLLILAVILVMMVWQPDIGTMAIIALTAVTVYWLAGGKYRHLAGIFVIGLMALFGLIKAAPYRLARFTVFLNPESDPLGIGYHLKQALLAVGSGGVWGLGLGLSRQKHLYLPEVIGDSVFAVIAEEMGFIFSVGLIGLFFLLVYRGLKIASGAPDQFGRLLASGVAAWIGFQIIINISAMIGLLPLTGLTLPFISYGSSSLVTLLLASGILVNISKQTRSGRN